MVEFKEYLRFPDFEVATDYTTILEKYQIPFQINDVSSHFQLYVPEVNLENPIVLKIREQDFKTVDEILEKELDKQVSQTTYDHYMYSFEDKDILDVIANQKDWTKAEVKLAIQIANDRKLDLTASTIKSAKKITEIKPEFKPTVEGSSSWFWTFGIFTIANGVLQLYNSKFHLPGLTVTEVLNVTSKLMFGQATIVGFLISLLFASLLFIIGRYGKKKNRKVFLTGIIFLGLDGILTVMTKNWFDILFRMLALWGTISALVSSYKENAESHSSTNA